MRSGLATRQRLGGSPPQREWGMMIVEEGGIPLR